MFSEKKSTASQKETLNKQSHSNSAILRKSNQALKPNGPQPGYQILSDRDGIVLIQSEVQEEYSSLPENLQNQTYIDQSELMNQSLDISVKDDVDASMVKLSRASQKWQE